MRSFRIRSSATSKSLARLLLYKVLVEDHAPSATPQDAVHVIVVTNMFSVAVQRSIVLGWLKTSLSHATVNANDFWAP